MRDKHLTANMARYTAYTFRQNKFDEEVEGILSDVAKVAAKGEYSINICGGMSVETTNRLIELGYNIVEGGRMNEIEYNITWK